MSKYTTEVRYICEHLCGLDVSKGYADIGTILSNARSKVFDFSYPIFDEEYRSTLETKILKHFYTREIGEETYGLWKLRLDRKMNEIMPYYNVLYKAKLDEFNPLLTVDMRTERSTVNGTNRNADESINDDTNTRSVGVNESNNDSTAKVNNRGLVDNGNVDKAKRMDLYSDTPQGQLSGIDADVPTYLTNARKVEDDNIGNNHTHSLDVGESENSANGKESSSQISTGNLSRDRKFNEDVNSTEKLIERNYGYNGVIPADLLKKFREVIWNVDLMIIDELEPLFMQLW